MDISRHICKQDASIQQTLLQSYPKNQERVNTMNWKIWTTKMTERGEELTLCNPFAMLALQSLDTN